jgi:choline-glycine betaine transporter
VTSTVAKGAWNLVVAISVVMAKLLTEIARLCKVKELALSRLVVSTAIFIVWITDINGLCLSLNDSGIAGYHGQASTRIWYDVLAKCVRLNSTGTSQY